MGGEVDAAESKMGDAGKGSFQQSQDASQAGAQAQGEDWRDKLKDDLAGGQPPTEGRKDAAGPGRGRF